MKDLSHDDAGKDLNPHPVPYYTSSMGLSFFFFEDSDPARFFTRLEF